MNDKIVIITGANSGIGKAATQKFATEGYRVIMACRNMEISAIVQKEIIETTINRLKIPSVHNNMEIEGNKQLIPL